MSGWREQGRRRCWRTAAVSERRIAIGARRRIEGACSGAGKSSGSPVRTEAGRGVGERRVCIRPCRRVERPDLPFPFPWLLPSVRVVLWWLAPVGVRLILALLNLGSTPTGMEKFVVRAERTFAAGRARARNRAILSVYFDRASRVVAPRLLEGLLNDPVDSAYTANKSGARDGERRHSGRGRSSRARCRS